MKKNIRDNIKSIILTLILYIIIAIIIIITVNYQNPNFIQVFSTLISLLILVTVMEVLEQAILSTVKLKVVTQYLLVGKEIMTSLLITLVSLLGVAKVMEIYYADAPFDKFIFNTLISLTFIVSLILYWLYSKLNISHKIDSGSRRIFKNTSPPIINFKKSLDKKETLDIIDAFAIFTTVFLLGNSTFSSSDLNQTGSTVIFFESLEYYMLFIVMSIYVLAAYHRLPKVIK